MIFRWLNEINSNFIIFGLCWIIVFSCKKIEREPKVETGAVTDITINSARAAGNIIDAGDGIIDHGHCWSITSNPTITDSRTSLGTKISTGSFTSVLDNLVRGMNYYVRAYVKDKYDLIYYGGQSFFTTNSFELATLTTTPVTSITSTSAVSGGNITSEGYAPVWAWGICWSTSQNPTTADYHTSEGSGKGSFVSTLAGLMANTTYFVRAYATNNVGTAYGNQVSFTTPFETFADTRDGKIYKIIKIGNQVWMAENLAFLPSVNPSSDISWTLPYYYVYAYEGTSISAAKATENYTTYGVLYNWPAAMAGGTSSTSNPSGVQGVCPTGWHLPSHAEWTELIDYLGGDNIATGKLKAINSVQPLCMDPSATNESGFTAIFGGALNCCGDGFLQLGGGGYWWSTSELEGAATCLFLGCGNPLLNLGISIVADGQSIRCIKNN